ncbi:hypothetical protein BC629DRAFT_1552743, partial [Irpex lacteus]
MLLASLLASTSNSSLYSILSTVIVLCCLYFRFSLVSFSILPPLHSSACSPLLCSSFSSFMSTASYYFSSLWTGGFSLSSFVLPSVSVGLVWARISLLYNDSE